MSRLVKAGKEDRIYEQMNSYRYRVYKGYIHDEMFLGVFDVQEGKWPLLDNITEQEITELLKKY
jgi:hypothetical protein